MDSIDCSRDKYAFDALVKSNPTLEPVAKVIFDWIMLANQTLPSPLEHSIDPRKIEEVFSELLRLRDEGFLDEETLKPIVNILRYLIHKFSERVRNYYERAETYDYSTASLTKIYLELYKGEVVTES